MDELRLRARRASTTVTVTVAGDLDVATKPELVVFLAGVLLAGDQRMVLNLGGVTFIDASGAGALVGFWKLARQQDTALVLVDSADCVLRLLAITGLDLLFVLA
ncbi:STAS domain-containing protein [Actinomadura rupiterrae]|uniref:STAS domain-containing protein n=1 Tax=Actinomadura rupiterrae TaxID=559627 RepID=UPI0020A44F0E|nr:STAS domain-containing protein [Actinomadura rupiterrae]MCP2337352.1 anti-sigma B factor antagonist [Actinomadura rupiterrae]